MKRTLLIIASALFIALMVDSCVSCDNKDGQNEGQDTTTITVEPNETNTQAVDNAKEEVKEAPKPEVKSSLILRSDIDKVNKLIREGRCDDAAKEISSWSDKKPDKGISLLKDIDITYNNNECAKIVGDAINGLGDARRKNAK